MRIVIAGGHGQIARQFSRLVTETGHQPVGMVRSPEHITDLEQDGAEPAMIDLETADLAEMTDIVRGADAVLFAAGGGPDGNAQRKETVDKGAAIMLADAAEAAGVRRYVMVSAMGTHDVEHAAEAMRPYLQAKKDADDALIASGLDWTIVRPGRLTDDPGTGTVDAARALSRYGEITRDDTALVLLETLVRPSLARVAFDVLGGPTPVAEALDAL